MRGIYVVDDLSGLEGIHKKVDYQIKAINQEGLNIVKYQIPMATLIDKVIRRIPLLPVPKRLKFTNDFTMIDYVYIRKPIIDMYLINELRKMKRNNYNIKIIIEIPTYPYDKELTRRKIDFTVLSKEKVWRKLLYKYVDRIVTYSGDKEIFNIQTINISNGVDTKLICPRVPIKHEGINVIAVALFARWHGYDKFIKGLYTYYKNKSTQKIYLHLVGNGDELEHYKQLVGQYNLHDKVIFYGKQVGEKLDEIYNKCDIALDAMGRHRSGVYYNSTLKGKEYAAKGIPSISGVTTELDYATEFKYYLRIPADETDVDIEQVINFYTSIYRCGVSQKEVVDQIRKYAEEHFDMNICLKPVIDYIKGENKI